MTAPTPPNFETLYVHEINEQMETLAAAILNGNARDYAEYKGMVGQYRGLAVSKNRFIDLMQQWEDREDPPR